MEIHTVLDTAEPGLAGIGGEFLAGSGFENEDSDTDFAAEVVTVNAADPRED
jgi:hypothetical protein